MQSVSRAHSAKTCTRDIELLDHFCVYVTVCREESGIEGGKDDFSPLRASFVILIPISSLDQSLQTSTKRARGSTAAIRHHHMCIDWGNTFRRISDGIGKFPRGSEREYARDEG